MLQPRVIVCAMLMTLALVVACERQESIVSAQPETEVALKKDLPGFEEAVSVAAQEFSSFYQGQCEFEGFARLADIEVSRLPEGFEASRPMAEWLENSKHGETSLWILFEDPETKYSILFYWSRDSIDDVDVVLSAWLNPQKLDI